MVKKRLILILVASILIMSIYSPVLSSSSKGYRDVTLSDWYYEYVYVMSESGSISGYGDSTFRPYNNMTVAEFVKTLLGEMGLEYIPSEGNEHWATRMMFMAEVADIVAEGKSSIKDWERPILRVEMADMIIRATGVDDFGDLSQYENSITDYNNMPRIHQMIALKIYYMGIMTGNNLGEFKFYDFATRAEACTMLARFSHEDYRKLPEVKNIRENGSTYSKWDYSNTSTVSNNDSSDNITVNENTNTEPAVDVKVTESKDNDIVAYAKQFLGVPYRWGGSSPSVGFDCSGFTMYVFNHFGIKLPHRADLQFKYGSKVNKNQLKPGDLVFFYKSGTNYISHCGIYIGNNQFIHAVSSRYDGYEVKISSLTGYYSREYAGATRLR